MNRRLFSLATTLFLIVLLGIASGYFFITVRSVFQAEEYVNAAHTLTESDDSARLLFVGDMMFDRYIRKQAQLHGDDHILSCVDQLLQSVDMVVGNLEGPITTYDSVSLDSEIGSTNNFVFTFATTTASLLKRHNIEIVSLGNNHIGNFGWEGVHSTKEHLKNAGVDYFGGLSGVEPIHRTTQNGVLISFIAYNEFGGKKYLEVANDIRLEKEKGNTVIVYAHWGDEYVDSRDRLRPLAATFVESGADLVVGTHPHIVLPSEVIGGVPVYYSLGNFVFDQYWKPEVREGLALEVLITKDEVVVTEHSTILEREGKTCAAPTFDILTP